MAHQTKYTGHIGGWLPDKPDFRDLKFTPTFGPVLPPSVDNSRTPFEPHIWNQGFIGSCTGHGIGHVLLFALKKQNLPYVMPSRLFIYWNERFMEGRVDIDSGASIRDGIKVVNSVGYSDEAYWPYVEANFKIKPPLNAFNDAKKRKAVSYRAVSQTESGIKQALASGFPVVFGFTCYQSLDTEEVGRTGVIPLPQKTESVIGGHCVTLVGYDDSTKLFKFRNSWGTTWGQNGYGFLPYAYILNYGLASDFWVVDIVS